jgi:hypothetical protein
MIIVALILSLGFGFVGFIVTKNNARYILSGYNMMSEQERQLFDLDSYLRFFRKFHLVLAFTLLGGVFLISLANNNWASIFMIVYPLCAYLYFFVATTLTYLPKSRKKVSTYLTGAFLFVVTIVIVVSIFRDFKSSDLLLTKTTMEIDGSYGLTLNRAEVLGVELVNTLPEIAYKSNGFAAGDYAKGSFETNDGKSVRLFVNKDIRPSLLIKTSEGEIYYNHEEKNMQALKRDLETWLLPKP